MNYTGRLFYKIFWLFLIFILGCAERKVVVSAKENNNRQQNILPEKNFVASEWNSLPDIRSEGDPDAVKGGTIVMSFPEFPPTFRIIGKDTHLVTIALMEGLVYESLLSLDHEKMSYRPNLASHWRISEDQTVYWFRINPQARFSDGTPVTAQDVVATFKLMIDRGIEDPSLSELFSDNFEVPVAESRYVVRVVCKKVNWRNFMYFSGFSILPAHHCERLDGRGYLKKYQFQMMPGTGPYILDLRKTGKNRRILLKRRSDFWGQDLPQNKGLYNFDQIKFIMVMDERLELEKFKKGELDIYVPSRAKWWKEELDEEKLDVLSRGLVLKRKIFNYKPLGMSGIALNMLEPPFDDLRVRKAFSLLWNFDQLNKTIFYGEYIRCHSYFQGTIYENPGNPVPVYDPEQARKLLFEAGWQEMKGSPYLMKDGKIFELDFVIDEGLNKIFTPFQQDLLKAGIKLNLMNATGHAIFEKIMKKKFKMAYLAWTGLLFPNPESSMHSKYASVSHTNNITGLKNERIDQICEKYNQSYDANERKELLWELDGIATREYAYAMGWVAPYAARIAFWNKFSFPESGLGYLGDWRSIFSLWWIDPKKKELLKQAKNQKNVILKKGEEVIDTWKKTGEGS